MYTNLDVIQTLEKVAVNADVNFSEVLRAIFHGEVPNLSNAEIIDVLFKDFDRLKADYDLFKQKVGEVNQALEEGEYRNARILLKWLEDEYPCHPDVVSLILTLRFIED